jgi:hypothetical protein
MFRFLFLNITFEQINQRVFNVNFFGHNLRDLNREGREIDPATATASPDRLGSTAGEGWRLMGGLLIGLVAVSGLDSAACVRQASLVDRQGMGVHPWVS